MNTQMNLFGKKVDKLLPEIKKEKKEELCLEIFDEEDPMCDDPIDCLECDSREECCGSLDDTSILSFWDSKRKIMH